MNYLLKKVYEMPVVGLRSLLILLLMALTFVQCQTTRIDLPAGFAAYEDSHPVFEATSADAMRLKVRSTNNEPSASLPVLRNTVALHFKSIGYRILREEPVQTDNGLSGHMFITAVKTLNGEYHYMTAFFLDGDKVRIVEAAGQKDAFEKHQAALIQKLKTLQSTYW